MEEIREDVLSENAMILEDLNECVIGVDQRGFLVYSMSLLIDHFVNDGMTEATAKEWILYNILNLSDCFTVIMEEL